MKLRFTENPATRQDKQLSGVSLDAVLAKRRLDQALNAKEFAVCAGVSYSTARSWFRQPGFPVFRGYVFWQDFVQWRTGRNASPAESHPSPNGLPVDASRNLPARAARILNEAARNISQP
jgi:hypothetical protein